ncbi:hypothetical protein [uncultured Massilia sp.]|uniref:hypothetical protein n=1 Tax=uncultured Massilia sp. TaxID=169973 RepID=UPI002587E636|nr:hypothetical protein [uncultured Massilia sp.]
MISLACWSLTTQAADATAPAVRSPAQLEAVLSSSQATPLDALTPYGKRRFLASLRWNDKGLAAFNSDILVRELEPQQLAGVLAFIGAEAHLPALEKELTGRPLRMQAPSADAVARLEAIERLAADGNRDPAKLARRYVDLYKLRFSEHTLADLPPADLPAYFDAAALAAQGEIGSQGEPIYWNYPLRHMLMAYTALRDRGIDTRRSIDATVLRSLIQARQLDMAREFMRGKPHLHSLTVPAPKEPFGSGFIGHDDDRLAGTAY